MNRKSPFSFKFSGSETGDAVGVQDYIDNLSPMPGVPGVEQEAQESSPLFSFRLADDEQPPPPEPVKLSRSERVKRTVLGSLRAVGAVGTVTAAVPPLYSGKPIPQDRHSVTEIPLDSGEPRSMPEEKRPFYVPPVPTYPSSYVSPDQAKHLLEAPTRGIKRNLPLAASNMLRFGGVFAPDEDAIKNIPEAARQIPKVTAGPYGAFNPLSMVSEQDFTGTADTWREKIMAIPVPEAAPEFQRAPEKFSEWLQPERIWNAFWENAPLTATLAGAYVLNPAIGTMMMMAVEGGSEKEAVDDYEKRTGKKLNALQRKGIPIAVGAVNAALEKTGIDVMLGKGVGGRVARNRIVKSLISAGTEGATEAGQELVSVLGELGFNSDAAQDLSQRTLQSFYGGLVTGGILGGVMPNIADDGGGGSPDLTDQQYEEMTGKQRIDTGQAAFDEFIARKPVEGGVLAPGDQKIASREESERIRAEKKERKTRLLESATTANAPENLTITEEIEWLQHLGYPESVIVRLSGGERTAIVKGLLEYDGDVEDVSTVPEIVIAPPAVKEVTKQEPIQPTMVDNVTEELGGEGGNEVAAADVAPKPKKAGDVFSGKAYRVESSNLGIPRGATAKDIVDFEADELGNEDIREQAIAMGVDLSQYPAESAVWVTDNQEDADYYLPEEERGQQPSLIEESDISKDNVIIATDYQGGYLVLQNYKPELDVAESNIKAEPELTGEQIKKEAKAKPATTGGAKFKWHGDNVLLKDDAVTPAMGAVRRVGNYGGMAEHFKDVHVEGTVQSGVDESGRPVTRRSAIFSHSKPFLTNQNTEEIELLKADKRNVRGKGSKHRKAEIQFKIDKLVREGDRVDNTDKAVEDYNHYVENSDDLSLHRVSDWSELLDLAKADYSGILENSDTAEETGQRERNQGYTDADIIEIERQMKEDNPDEPEIDETIGRVQETAQREAEEEVLRDEGEELDEEAYDELMGFFGSKAEETTETPSESPTDEAPPEITTPQKPEQKPTEPAIPVSETAPTVKPDTTEKPLHLITLSEAIDRRINKLKDFGQGFDFVIAQKRATHDHKLAVADALKNNILPYEGWNHEHPDISVRKYAQWAHTDPSRVATKVEDEETTPADAERIQFDLGDNNPDKMGAVLNRSAKHPGKWQITFFDKTGFTSDLTQDTKEKALDILNGMSFEKSKRDLLGSIVGTKEFIAGNEKTVHPNASVNIDTIAEKHGISRSQKEFITKKIKAIGSFDAAKAKYGTDSAIDKFAREAAGAVYGVEVKPEPAKKTTAKKPKSPTTTKPEAPKKTRKIKADRTTAAVDMVDARSGDPIKAGDVIYHLTDTNETVSDATYQKMIDIRPQETLFEAGKDEKQGKEPWEMTREEFRNEIRKQGEKKRFTDSVSIDDFNKEGTVDYPFPKTIKAGGDTYTWSIGNKKKKGSSMAISTQIYINSDKLPTGLVKLSLGKEIFDKKHATQILRVIRKSQVEQALSENKPIPDAVKAEYPDLFPKKPVEKAPKEDKQKNMIDDLTGQKDMFGEKKSEHAKLLNSITAVVSKEFDIDVPNDSFLVVNPNTDAEKAAVKVGSVFGQKVVFVEPQAAVDVFNGITVGNTIVLNRYASNHHIAVAGHEITHRLKAEYPELYKQLSDAINEDAEAFKKFRKDRTDVYPETPIDSPEDVAAINEEFIGDTVGERMSDPEFWNKMHEKSPTLVQKIKVFLNNILMKLSMSKDFKTSQFFKDIQKVKNIVDNALTGFAEKKADSKKPDIVPDDTATRFQRKRRLDARVQLLKGTMPEKGRDVIVRKRTSSIIKNKIRDLKQGHRLGKLDVAEELTELKKQITKYARITLPQKGITRGQIKPVLTQIASAKSADDVSAAFDRIDNVARTVAEKDLRRNIADALRKSTPGKVRGRIHGAKLTADINAQLAAIKRIMDLSKSEALEKTSKILESADSATNQRDLTAEEERAIHLLGMFSDYKNKSIEELPEIKKNLDSLIETGKILRDHKDELRRSKMGEIKNRTIGVLTGGRGVLSPENARSEGRDKKEGIFDKGAFQTSFEYLLDKVSRLDKKSKPLHSFINEYFTPIIREARNAENKGNRELSELTRKKLQDIYGTDNKRKLLRALNKNTQQENTGIFIEQPVDGDMSEGAETERIELILSQNEAYKLWQMWQDPSLGETFAKMGYTPETMDAIGKFIDPKVMAWAKWQIDDFYPMYYDTINAVFRERFDVDLPYNPFYTPIFRDVAGETIDDQLLQNNGVFTSMINNHLLARVDNVHSLRIVDGDNVLSSHIMQMEHFKAWVNPIRDLRSVWNNKDVKKAMRQYHGTGSVTVMDKFINDFARGGVDREMANNTLDKLRSNFTKAVLGANPTIFIKQMTSMPAYAADIPTLSFATGMLDFMTNPVRKYNILMQSEMMKARHKVGFERDIRLAMGKTTQEKLSGKRTLSDNLLFFTQLGDKGAIIMGGWGTYKYHFDKAIAAGKTKAVANKMAIAEFEQSTKRSQQASDIEDLSDIQRRGSWAKLFTMFMTAPHAYYRAEMAAVRNLKAGRGSKAHNLKTIAISHFILPMLFQFAANGFDWKKEEQLRAMILGSLNGFLIVGDYILEPLANGIAGGYQFGARSVPIFSNVEKLQSAMGKMNKMVAGDDKDNPITTKDVLSVIDNMASAFSKPAGVPYDPIKRIATGTRDYMAGEADIRRVMGYSKYALKSPTLAESKKRIFSEKEEEQFRESNQRLVDAKEIKVSTGRRRIATFRKNQRDVLAKLKKQNTQSK